MALIPLVADGDGLGGEPVHLLRGVLGTGDALTGEEAALLVVVLGPAQDRNQAGGKANHLRSFVQAQPGRAGEAVLLAFVLLGERQPILLVAGADGNGDRRLVEAVVG